MFVTPKTSSRRKTLAFKDEKINKISNSTSRIVTRRSVYLESAAKKPSTPLVLSQNNDSSSQSSIDLSQCNLISH
jgi:hypothetical protein